MAQFLYWYIRTASYGTVPVPIHPNIQLWHSSCTDTSEQPVMAHFLYWYIWTASYGTVLVPIHPNSELWYSSCTDTSEQPVMAHFLYRYIWTASYGTVPVPIHLNSQLWHSSCTDTSEQPVMAQFLYRYIWTASYGTVPAPTQHLSRKLWRSSCTNATSGQSAISHFLHQSKVHEKDLKTSDYSLNQYMKGLSNVWGTFDICSDTTFQMRDPFPSSVSGCHYTVGFETFLFYQW
jgi:hypothetical protein